MTSFGQSYSQMFYVEKLNSAMNFRVKFFKTRCIQSVILGARCKATNIGAFLSHHFMLDLHVV